MSKIIAFTEISGLVLQIGRQNHVYLVGWGLPEKLTEGRFWWLEPVRWPWRWGKRSGIHCSGFYWRGRRLRIGPSPCWWWVRRAQGRQTWWWSRQCQRWPPCPSTSTDTRGSCNGSYPETHVTLVTKATFWASWTVAKSRSPLLKGSLPKEEIRIKESSNLPSFVSVKMEKNCQF